MPFATPNQDLVLVLAVNDQGIPVLVTEAQMRVLGPLGLIQDWASLDVSMATPGTFPFTVPASCNQLADPTTIEGRVVEIEARTTGVSGIAKLIADYTLGSPADTLVIQTNSFQTYPDAIATAALLTDLPGWLPAPQDQRVAALSEAYDALVRLSYDLSYDDDGWHARGLAGWGLGYAVGIGRLQTYTAEEFLALDKDFLKRIKQAQVVEADHRLRGSDTIEALRDQGLVSEKVGESSRLFRGKRPFSFMVCQRALKTLSGYVRTNPRLTRA